MDLKKEICQSFRVEIVTLREKGYSQREIAQKVGVSQNGVK